MASACGSGAACASSAARCCTDAGGSPRSGDTPALLPDAGCELRMRASLRQAVARGGTLLSSAEHPEERLKFNPYTAPQRRRGARLLGLPGAALERHHEGLVLPPRSGLLYPPPPPPPPALLPAL